MISPHAPDSPYAWTRLLVSLALSTIGGIGLWSAVVVLPAIQAEFGIDRSAASLPYTATTIGFALGGIAMGRAADRFGITTPLVFGSAMLGGGFILAGLSSGYWQFVLIQALLVGMLGSSVIFGPLVADISQWFLRRRGIAVAIVASGNYVAGALWPPFLQRSIDAYGWRPSYIVIGVLCAVTMIPLALLLKQRPVFSDQASPASTSSGTGLLAKPRYLQSLLVVAGLTCCVAMSTPQVHIVAYSADLGYGPARGAEMLALMLAFGVVSRLASGLIADRLGGVMTLIIGSSLQTLALFFYIPFDGLTSLYVVSALFGLSQGGIVPSYALIIRDHYPAREAGTRISLVLTATVVGMALGGWLSGEIYDLTGSYRAAFLNGIAFNLVNMGLAFWLLMGRRNRGSIFGT